MVEPELKTVKLCLGLKRFCITSVTQIYLFVIGRIFKDTKYKAQTGKTTSYMYTYLFFKIYLTNGYIHVLFIVNNNWNWYGP